MQVGGTASAVNPYTGGGLRKKVADVYAIVTGQVTASPVKGVNVGAVPINCARGDTLVQIQSLASKGAGVA